MGIVKCSPGGIVVVPLRNSPAVLLKHKEKGGSEYR